MDLGEFTILLALNLEAYIIYLLIASFLYFLLYKNYFKGLFDPFFFYFLLVFIFCTANILFLFSLNEISLFYLTNHLLCQLIFYFGYTRFSSYRKLLIPNPNKQLENNFQISDKVTIYTYFSISFVVFFILQPSVYILSGIPLFMKSRWQAFDNSGGLGLIDRLLDVFRFVLTFTTFWLIFSNKPKNLFEKFILYISLLGLLFTSILNGSKMAILDYVYILTFVSLAKRAQGIKLSSIKSVQNILLFFSIIGAFVAIIIHYQVNDVEYSLMAEDYRNPIYAFLLRFIYSGDVYIMAYPNDTIYTIPWYNPFVGLFRNIIGMLRIIPWDNISKDVGFSLYGVFDIDSDIPRGPTMKFDIFSLFFFGYVGSLIFSFFTGFVFSYFQNKKFAIGKNFTFYLIYSLVLYHLFIFPINPPVAISKLFNIFLFFFIPRFIFKLALGNVRNFSKV